MNAYGWSSPSNILDLAVLGVASERARSAPELLAAVRHIGGGRFQPTAEVVGGRIAALAEAGRLVPVAGEGAGTRWRPSRAGQAHIRRLLLMRSGPPVDALAAVCAYLKICFLEMLEGAARRAVLDDLLAAHRSALSDAEAALAGCPCRCELVRRYLARRRALARRARLARRAARPDRGSRRGLSGAATEGAWPAMAASFSPDPPPAPSGPRVGAGAAARLPARRPRHPRA